MEEQTVDQEYDIVPSNGGISIDQVIESNWTGVAIWLQMNKVLDGDKYGIIEHAVMVYLSSNISEGKRTPADTQKVFGLTAGKWRRVVGNLQSLSFAVDSGSTNKKMWGPTDTWREVFRQAMSSTTVPENNSLETTVPQNNSLSPTTVLESNSLETTVPQNNSLSPTTVPESNSLETTVPQNNSLATTVPEDNSLSPTTVPENNSWPSVRYYLENWNLYNIVTIYNTSKKLYSDIVWKQPLFTTKNKTTTTSFASHDPSIRESARAVEEPPPPSESDIPPEMAYDDGPPEHWEPEHESTMPVIRTETALSRTNVPEAVSRVLDAYPFVLRGQYRPEGDTAMQVLESTFWEQLDPTIRSARSQTRRRDGGGYQSMGNYFSPSKDAVWGKSQQYDLLLVQLSEAEELLEETKWYEVVYDMVRSIEAGMAEFKNSKTKLRDRPQYLGFFVRGLEDILDKALQAHRKAQDQILRSARASQAELSDIDRLLAMADSAVNPSGELFSALKPTLHLMSYALASADLLQRSKEGHAIALDEHLHREQTAPLERFIHLEEIAQLPLLSRSGTAHRILPWSLSGKPEADRTGRAYLQEVVLHCMESGIGARLHEETPNAFSTEVAIDLIDEKLPNVEGSAERMAQRRAICYMQAIATTLSRQAMRSMCCLHPLDYYRQGTEDRVQRTVRNVFLRRGLGIEKFNGLDQPVSVMDTDYSSNTFQLEDRFAQLNTVALTDLKALTLLGPALEDILLSLAMAQAVIQSGKEIDPDYILGLRPMVNPHAEYRPYHTGEIDIASFVGLSPPGSMVPNPGTMASGYGLMPLSTAMGTTLNHTHNESMRALQTRSFQDWKERILPSLSEGEDPVLDGYRMARLIYIHGKQFDLLHTVASAIGLGTRTIALSQSYLHTITAEKKQGYVNFDETFKSRENLSYYRKIHAESASSLQVPYAMSNTKIARTQSQTIVEFSEYLVRTGLSTEWVQLAEGSNILDNSSKSNIYLLDRKATG